MATVRNITPDTLGLFDKDAPPIYPGDEVTVRDSVFVDRTWATSTWELVTPPEGDYQDASTDEAILFLTPAPPAGEPDDSWLAKDVKAWVEEHNIDVGDATTKAAILAVLQERKGEG